MNSEKTEPILIGIKEAVEYTGIGRNTLLEMVKIKGFPCISTGGKYYLIRNELEQYFSKNRGIYTK